MQQRRIITYSAFSALPGEHAAALLQPSSEKNNANQACALGRITSPSPVHHTPHPSQFPLLTQAMLACQKACELLAC